MDIMRNNFSDSLIKEVFMIKKKLFRIGTGLVLTTALTGFAIAQDPTPSPTVSPSPMPTMTPTPMPTPSPMLTPTPTPTPDISMVAQYSPQQEMPAVETTLGQDDKWTVIEYPEGQDVVVELAPYQVQGAQGSAHVIRTAEETTINLDVSGLPADVKDYYVYIVDPTGAVSVLGQITTENGANKTF